MGRTHLALGIVVGLAACNPYGSDAFVCETDDQCGADGRCELTGFCSFPVEESRCGPGGRAYGDHSGPRSGQCATSDIMPIVDAPIDAPPPQTCDPGASQCYGNAIETCKTNGQGFDPNLRVPCALACDEGGGAPRCLAASNISVSEQLGCGTGTDGALDLQAPSGAIVTIGASSITCSGCNGGVTTIPARGTTPNVWYCLKTLTLANDADVRSSNVGPVTLFVAGQTQLDSDIQFDGGDANAINGGGPGGPGAHGGASFNGANGNSGGGPCAGGGGAQVGNVNPALVTAGGGGGAAAAGTGGNGGDGNGPMATVGAGGTGGNSSGQCDSESFAQLFGGSGGGSGGDGACSGLPCAGGGGGGGGAIHIATRATLMGSGDIDVSGGNGAGGSQLGDQQATGGGGGAGGMVFLEAPNVSFTGELDTRGGDGGRSNGNGAENNLDGGGGRDGQTEGDGGGGGGGAAGRIRIHAVTGASCGTAQPQPACATGPLRLQ